LADISSNVQDECGQANAGAIDDLLWILNS
jgi:hypothetical protein